MRIAVRRFRHLYAYCTENVWRDPRDVWYVKLLKVVNLSVKSFFDKNIQTLASSLTYTTLLAVIPILSLLLAIARGFGMRDVLIQSLYKGLPSQRAMLENSLDFVDRFLATLSKGVFVGIGVVFLLWTLVSMLRKIESVYNHVWNVRKGRPIYRRITDYTAILLIIPILLICSGGLSIFLSNFVQESINSPIGVLSPVLKFLLDLSPVFLLGVLFVGMNVLIPYTKVKLKNALLPGFVCGVLFLFHPVCLCAWSDIRDKIQCRLWRIRFSSAVSDLDAAVVDSVYRVCGDDLFIAEFLQFQLSGTGEESIGTLCRPSGTVCDSHRCEPF